MDMPVDYRVRCNTGTISKSHAKAEQHHTELKDRFCLRYGMICLTRSLIRQLYHFATEFDRLLIQLVILSYCKHLV